MKTESLIPLSIIALAISFFFFLIGPTQETVDEHRRTIDSLRAELSYFENTYHFRVGTIHDENGNPETIRALSIDNGKNWLLLSQGREVKQSRYLSIEYPELDPDTLEKVY